LSYSGIPIPNETRIIVDGVNSDTDDWDGVVDEVGLIESIRVYAPGDRPASGFSMRTQDFSIVERSTLSLPITGNATGTNSLSFEVRAVSGVVPKDVKVLFNYNIGAGDVQLHIDIVAGTSVDDAALAITTVIDTIPGLGALAFSAMFAVTPEDGVTLSTCIFTVIPNPSQTRTSISLRTGPFSGDSGPLIGQVTYWVNFINSTVEIDNDDPDSIPDGVVTFSEAYSRLVAIGALALANEVQAKIDAGPPSSPIP
jgi:hypothetical protein